MLILIAGLALFLGVHSVRIFAEEPRRRFIAERGENAWKTLYSLVAALGLVLIVVGYGRASADPVLLWSPPLWLRHVTLLLTAVAFVLLAAAYVPGNRIRAAVGHPMVLGVKVWAFAHLLANGTLPSLVLFGAFLAWAVADFVAARRRDRREGIERTASGGLGASLATVAAGLVAWVLFVGWLHRWLIGVSPIAIGGGA